MDIFTNLDKGITSIQEHKEIENLEIKNPFFNRDKIIVGDKFIKIINSKNKEIYYNFNKLYVLCLKEDKQINKTIYNKCLSIQDLKLLSDNLQVVEGDIKLLSNSVHKSQVVYVDNYYLSLINKTFDYDDKELVLPLINISVDTFKLYLAQYKGLFKIDDYYKIKIANQFYRNPYPNTNVISGIIKNIAQSNYWSKRMNTKLNITNKFIKRGFNLSISQRIQDLEVKNVLEELTKMPEEGDAYLSYLFKRNTYVDISNAINKKGYSLYKINDDIKLTKDDVNYILHNNIKTTYEVYTFTMNLLVSKDYCHLVLKNKDFLQKIKSWHNPFTNEEENLIEKYKLAFKYAISYSWMALYIEESIKKTNITEDDRFVFTLDEAAELPHFSFTYDKFRDCPYLTLPIADNILDIKNNILGLPIMKKKYGVNTFKKFKENMNIFLMSDKNNDILEGVDMTNLGISGSIIPACITKFNPLMMLFNNTDRYFKEYYATSDVDIMCNIQDDFEYIDRIHKFYGQISKKFNKLTDYNERNIELSHVKVAALIVNESYIRKNIVIKQTKFTYEYILSNLDKIEVKELFHKKYLEYKLNKNQKYFEDPKWKLSKYKLYFDIVPVNDIRVVFARTKEDWKLYWSQIKKKSEENQENNETDIYFDNKNDIEEEEEKEDNQNILFKCFENIKYRIKSKYLNHDFELFKVRWPGSFFSTVSKFHLPCVRGWTDGKQCHLLPSCITAAHTLINIDYKYFAGSKDPIEIITKYRQRGYSVILNDSEKIRFISYSSKVQKWNKLYGGINLGNRDTINKVLGYLDLSSSFFKPRRILKELYDKCTKVSDKYLECNDNNLYYKSNDEFDLLNDYTMYKSKNDINELYRFCNLKSISNYGYINTIKKWYFDAIYEKC